MSVPPIAVVVIKLVISGGLLLATGMLLASYKGLPVVGLILFALVIIYTFITQRTVIGRYIYSVGGNRNAAGLTGVNTKKVDFLVMVNMGLLAGVAGMVFTAYLNASNPKDGVGFELDAIAAVFIGGAAVAGGVGTVTGAMIGGLVMGVLNLGLANMSVDSNWIQVIKGLVLLGAVAFDVLSKKAGGRRSFVSMVMDAFSGKQGQGRHPRQPRRRAGPEPGCRGRRCRDHRLLGAGRRRGGPRHPRRRGGPGGTGQAQASRRPPARPRRPTVPLHAVGRRRSARGGVQSPDGGSAREQRRGTGLRTRMTPTADATISALRSTHDELAAVVRGLTDEQLLAPSGASEWPVAQVLSHLGSGAEIGLATLRAATGEGEAPGDGFNQSVWDRWNAMSPARAGRRLRRVGRGRSSPRSRR